MAKEEEKKEAAGESKPAESKTEAKKPFEPVSFLTEAVYDPVLEKKYGRRPEARVPHRYIMTAVAPKQRVIIVLNKQNTKALRAVLNALP